MVLNIFYEGLVNYSMTAGIETKSRHQVPAQLQNSQTGAQDIVVIYGNLE
jgi:hypothetical protein